MKQKIEKFKGSIFKRKATTILAVLALFSVALGLLPMPSAKAQTTGVKIVPNSIAFSADFQINGKNDNLIKIVKGQTAQMNVLLTVTSATNSDSNAPVSQINLGKDILDFKVALDADRIIKEIGVGLEGAATSTNTCSESIVRNFIPFTDNKTYVACQFKGGTKKIDGSAVVIKQQYSLSLSFAVDDGFMNNLGIGTNKPCPRSASKTSCFTIYPYVLMDKLGANKKLSAADGGKDIYIQVYDNQPAMDADPNRPTDIPGYGGTSGNLGAGATGGTLLGLINQLIGTLIGLAREFIYYVFYLFIAPIIQAMLSIRVYTDTFAAVIYPGWEIVRNLCNILFIVALIAIGLGTLFRIETYQYKHLLVDLIIAALLVNFSLVIAQAVLGVADTIQSQFLPNNVEVIRALARDLMSGWNDVGINLSTATNSGFFSNTVAPLFSLGLTLGSFVVFSAIAIFLFVRMIMLWVLLMLSPMAYAMRVLPQTKSYAGKWWGEFIKYAFFTPIMAFFLNMAAVINTTYSKIPVFQQIIDKPELVGDSSIAQFVFRVGGNFIILVFLMVAIKVAEGAGVYGADVVAKAAQGGLFAPFKGAGWLAGKGAGRVGRWYNEKTAHLVEQHGDHPVPWAKKALFAAVNPKAFAKGWSERSHELAHHAEEEATAAGRMVAEQYLTSGAKGIMSAGFLGKPQLTIPYNQFTARKHENDYVKDYENMRKESLMAAAVAAEKMGGAEGTMRRRAIVKAAAKQGYMDDLLRMRAFANKYADADGTVYSAEVLNRFLFGYLADDKGHIGEQAMRFMAEDMEELGKSTGHYEYLGHAYFDNDKKAFKRGMEETDQVATVTRGGQTHQIRKLKNTWQVGYAVGELKKISGRMRAQIAPHNLVALRAEVDKTTGEFKETGDELTDMQMGRENGGLDEYQRAAMAQFDAATLQQGTFAQSRLKEWLLSFEMDKRTGELIIRSEADFKRLEDAWKDNPGLMRAMYAQMVGIEGPQARNVTGLKAVYFDPATNTRESAVTHFGAAADALGDANSFDVPISTEISTDIAKNRTINLGLNDKDEMPSFIKEFSVIMPKIIQGKMSASDIESEAQRIMTKISPRFAPGAASNSKVAEVVADIKRKVSTEIKEKYDGIPIIEERNKEVFGKNAASQGLTPADISDLNNAMSEAAKDAFANAMSSAGGTAKVDPALIEAQVRARMASWAGTDLKKRRYFNNDTVNAIVTHIKSTS